ncbi:replication protein A 32 kDa subunit-like [Anoplopoma fimbria]|uniref:replication protein A 32 kDa subunit-like n=1 Tax=Anoplopoma fimbria TaxID=229290 RepID=UPI0023EDED1C|nr:replication protein A 32 kDa subunit-like [Anoplopoma fimbria]
MWNQACSQSPDETASQKAVKLKRKAHQILPCTVSQLLSAAQTSHDTFAICDRELNQVSVVGIIRGWVPFVTNIQFSVDDMTGPPLNVKHWDSTLMSTSPGTYMKVTGTLRSSNDQRSMLAINIRCVKDLNEITSHMLEVVHAHMRLFRKKFDVNMNTTAASLHSDDEHHKDVLPDGLSTLQGRVLTVLRRFSYCHTGISFHDLQKQLDYLSVRDIRTSLTSLINNGHVFCTIDEHHFKSTE